MLKKYIKIYFETVNGKGDNFDLNAVDILWGLGVIPIAIPIFIFGYPLHLFAKWLNT